MKPTAIVGFFDTMKPTAIVGNTARGPIIDESALLTALRAGTIAAAGFYESEPDLTPGLAECPNVVLSPHLGSAYVTPAPPWPASARPTRSPPRRPHAPDLASYEQYRQLCSREPEFIDADIVRDYSACVVRYERTFRHSSPQIRTTGDEGLGAYGPRCPRPGGAAARSGVSVHFGIRPRRSA